MKAFDRNFEDAAKEYLSYWLKGYWLKPKPYRPERDIVQLLSSPVKENRRAALKDAAAYFGVARNFPREYDVNRGKDRLLPALELLEAVPVSSLGAADAVRTVNSFRYTLASAYGHKDLLAPATKFLWLRCRDAVVIYDSQARKALGTPYHEYGRYVEQWNQGYLQNAQAIAAACTLLAEEGQALPFDRPIAKAELEALVTADWFGKRVYDIYLWRKGSEK